MELTFLTDLGEAFVVEIDPNMELENVMALLEAESGIPVAEQSIHYQNRELTNVKSTMRELAVQDDKAILQLRRKVANVAGRSIEQDSEMMRLQLLGDPDVMRQLRETQPELAAAAQSNPQRFAELLRQTRERQYEAQLAHQHEIERLNADPYNVEAQQRIEEAIRQQAVLENMEHALEYSPEFFGKVTMLYIPVEVNSKPVKAFVDSGAQQTIMSPECAEACGIMRLVDKRFSGIARGVGTARILGRVHSAQLKLADLHLPCCFTIIEGRDVDLLFGLDMLKAHQACIDLEKNVLRIQGREVRFLSEHELPDKAREPSEPSGEHLGGVSQSPSPGRISSGSSTSTSFSGGGRILGASPHTPAGGRPPTQSRPSASTHSEEAIRLLMEFGSNREQAIRALDAAGGDIDLAASMLF